MANTMQYRAALQNLLPIFFDSAPLLKTAFRDLKDSEVPAQKGKTVTINRPNMNQFEAASITAAAYGSGEQNVNSLPETITLDQHKGINYVGTDLEWSQAAWEGQVSPTMRIAVGELAKSVEAAIATKVIKSATRRVTKTSGAVADIASIVDAFQANRVPDGKKVLAVPSTSFFMGDTNLLSTLIGGGEMSGYDFNNRLLPISYSHALVGKTFTKGTGTGYVLNGAAVKGQTDIPIDTGSGTVVEGDIVTFASTKGSYTVETGVSAAGTITIYPGLEEDVADTSAMTIDDGTCASLGIALHEMGIAVAFRPEEIDPDSASQTVFATATDPTTGLSLNYEVRREYKQTRRILSVLYGLGKCMSEGVIRYKIS